MIGENMADDGDINGVVVSLRKSQDRIALWTKSAQKEDLQVPHPLACRQQIFADISVMYSSRLAPSSVRGLRFRQHSN
jgi:hypothetical protein